MLNRILNSKYTFPLVLLVYVLLAALTVPINTDGAWIMRDHNHLVSSGTWINPMWDAPDFFQSKVTAKIYSLFSSAPTYNYLIFRIPSILCLLSASFFIYQFGKSYFKDKNSSIFITLLYLFFATVYPSTGIVFRGEFFYSAVSVMLYSGLYMVFYAEKTNRLIYAIIPILLTPVAFSIHPVGLILYLAVMLFLLLHTIPFRTKIALGIIYSIYYGIVSYLLAFYPQSIMDFIYFTKEFKATRPPFYMEYLRYISLFMTGKEQIIVVLTSISGLAVYSFSKITRKKDLAWRKYSTLIFFSTLILFVLMPSRTLSYFSVLYFFFAFGIMFLADKYLCDKKAIKCAIIAISIFLMTFLWMDFFKNEDFIRGINLPNYRVSRLNILSDKIKDKKILGSILLYPFVARNAHFYPLEKITTAFKTFPDDLEFDFLLYPIELSGAKKSLNSLKRMKKIKDLSFQETYIWQGSNYILYKVSY